MGEFMSTISRMKRIEDAKLARSQAINRYLQDCQEQADDAKHQMYIVSGFFIFLSLVFLSAILGLN